MVSNNDLILLIVTERVDSQDDCFVLVCYNILEWIWYGRQCRLELIVSYGDLILLILTKRVGNKDDCFDLHFVPIFWNGFGMVETIC